MGVYGWCSRCGEWPSLCRCYGKSVQQPTLWPFGWWGAIVILLRRLWPKGGVLPARPGPIEHMGGGQGGGRRIWARLRDGRIRHIRRKRYWMLVIFGDAGILKPLSPAEEAVMAAPFGGKVIDFKGRKETAEDIFGTDDIGPSDMTRLLWAYVKEKNLMRKPKIGEDREV